MCPGPDGRFPRVLTKCFSHVANQDLFIQFKKYFISSSGWSLLVLSVGVWAVGRKACLVIDQNSLFVITHLVPSCDIYIHCISKAYTLLLQVCTQISLIMSTGFGTQL